MVLSKAVWGAALAGVLIAPATSLADGRHAHRKLDAVLARAVDAASGSPQRVIITVKPGAAASMRKRLAEHGYAIHAAHSLVNALTVTLSASDLRQFAEDSDVESMSVDADVASSATTSPATSSSSDVVSSLKQALGMQNWFTGATVTVAVIDSGIAPVADLSGRIVGEFDFTGGKGGVPVAPFDDFGHGTHVAGLIGASGVESNGVYGGVVGGVKLLALKALDKKGGGRTSDVISALQFAVANKDVYGIKVINLSLGHPIYESAATDPLVNAVEQAVHAGIVVVAAAGNYGRNPLTGVVGYGGIASPGNAPSAITVGAAQTFNTVSRQDDRVAPYSSRGPSWYDGIAKPDVLAPGDRLVSDIPDGSTLASLFPGLLVTSGSYKLMTLSGSSMSAGVVSGLVAAMFEAQQYGAQQRYNSTTKNLKKLLPFVPPAPFTPNAIKAMLEFSATSIHDATGLKYDALTQGTGVVNGVGAIELAYYADVTKPLGSYWLSTTFPYSTQFASTLEMWSGDVVWGTALLTGPSLAEVNQAAWSSSTVWGAGDLDDVVWGTMSEDGNVVWGTCVLLGGDVVWSGSVDTLDNVVWGTMTNWDDNIVWGTALVGFVDTDGNVVWGTYDSEDNIVWGTLTDDNVVWGTSTSKVRVLGSGGGDVW